MDPKDKVYIQKTLSQSRRFRKVTQNLASQVADKYDITYTQMLTLEILNNHPEMDLKELAHNLHLSKSSVSGIVERLLATALVSKHKQLADQRKLVIYLTSEGQALAIQIHDEFYDCLAPILELSKTERQQFMELNEKIIDNLEEVKHERQSSRS